MPKFDLKFKWKTYVKFWNRKDSDTKVYRNNAQNHKVHKLKTLGLRREAKLLFKVQQDTMN